jgi:AraC-like DNA-binding protein
MANPLKSSETASRAAAELTSTASTTVTDVQFGNGTILVVDAGPLCTLRWTRLKTGPSCLGPSTTLLFSRMRREVVLDGRRAHSLIHEESLCVLLAFADISLNRIDMNRGRRLEEVMLQALPQGYSSDLATLKNWLVRQAMTDDFHPFLNYLRACEAYLLTQHLLQAPELNVRTLCRQYGLSYTHFRRLCTRILEGSTKRKLRAWRAARAALQLLDGRRSLFDVAMDNGYASSSHICRDIKQHYGITPSTIMNAHVLLP